MAKRDGTKSLRAKARFLVMSLTIGAATFLGGQQADAATHHWLRHDHHSLVRHHLEFASAHEHQFYHPHHAYHGYRLAHEDYASYRIRHHHHYEYVGYYGYKYGYKYRGAHEEFGYRRDYAGYRVHYLRYTTRYRYSGIQCVPYAREVSHIDLSGNAFLWWAEAAGRYARGNTPEEGAVLNFRAIYRMPLGHVAVVTSVINSRTILVTQANWVRGTITNDVTMQDVSPNNDWTSVEVELGDSNTWGAAYPTYGFIYNQPADATTIASTSQGNEVAEAPIPTAINFTAPNRNLQ